MEFLGWHSWCASAGFRFVPSSSPSRKMSVRACVCLSLIVFVAIGRALPTIGPADGKTENGPPPEPVPPSSTTEAPTTTTPAVITTTSGNVTTTSTLKPTTTTKATTTSTSTSTSKPTPSTMEPPTVPTSAAPFVSTTPEPHAKNGFDGPSFVGGIALSLGLMCVGLMGWKFYKTRSERNYRTL